MTESLRQIVYSGEMHPRSRILSQLSLLSLALFLTSCATTDRSVGKVYPAAQVEQVTVVDRKVERVAATRGRVGSQAGSILGSAGGGIAGSILGGIIGPKIENTVVKRRVSNYSLRRTDGTVVTLIQSDAGKKPLQPGQPGYLVREGDGTSTLHTVRPTASE